MRSKANPLILKSSLGSNYTVTSSFTDITGLKITVPKDGFYLITGNINSSQSDTDSTSASTYIKIAINGNSINASGARLYHDDSVNGRNIYQCCPILKTIYLKKGDIVTIKAKMDAGDNSVIIATSANEATYIEALKIG